MQYLVKLNNCKLKKYKKCWFKDRPSSLGPCMGVWSTFGDNSWIGFYFLSAQSMGPSPIKFWALEIKNVLVKEARAFRAPLGMLRV